MLKPNLLEAKKRKGNIETEIYKFDESLKDLGKNKKYFIISI